MWRLKKAPRTFEMTDDFRWLRAFFFPWNSTNEKPHPPSFFLRDHSSYLYTQTEPQLRVRAFPRKIGLRSICPCPVFAVSSVASVRPSCPQDRKHCWEW